MNFLWWRRKQQERELEEEVRSHLEWRPKSGRSGRGQERSRAGGTARIWKCGIGEGGHAGRLGMALVERRRC